LAVAVRQVLALIQTVLKVVTVQIRCFQLLLLLVVAVVQLGTLKVLVLTVVAVAVHALTVQQELVLLIRVTLAVLLSRVNFGMVEVVVQVKQVRTELQLAVA
jgi:hypothetical protein